MEGMLGTCSFLSLSLFPGCHDVKTLSRHFPPHYDRKLLNSATFLSILSSVSELWGFLVRFVGNNIILFVCLCTRYCSSNLLEASFPGTGCFLPLWALVSRPLDSWGALVLHGVSLQPGTILRAVPVSLAPIIFKLQGHQAPPQFSWMAQNIHLWPVISQGEGSQLSVERYLFFMVTEFLISCILSIFFLCKRIILICLPLDF